MNTLKAFLYGIAVISAIVVFGIIGWGFNIFMAIIANAMWGVLIVLGLIMFVYMIFATKKESE